MKLVSFQLDGQVGIGVQVGEEIAVLSAAGFPASMRQFIAGGADLWQKASQTVSAGSCPRVPLSSVDLRAPVGDPTKVVAIGRNYREHAAEQNADLPTAPLIFAKFPSSVIGPFDQICWDPALTQKVDYEVELGVVLGRRARRVSEAEALEYVFGYTVLNDISARDLQFGDKQWVRGKSLDTFCPTGPGIVTADEIPDPQKLAIRCLVNGNVMQDSNTSEMVFGVAQLVSYCSQAFTLEPGDLIASGTPGGVGHFRKPPFYLKNGDVITTEVEKIGQIVNVVRL